MPDTSLTEKSRFDQIYGYIVVLFSYGLCAMHLLNLLPVIHINNFAFVTLNFMFGMLLCFFIYDWKGKDTGWSCWWKKLIDMVLAAGVVFVAVYIAGDVDTFQTRIQISATGLDMLVGLVAMVAVLEACRRMTGLALPIIALVGVAYALFGNLLPGALAHKAYSVNRVARSIISNQGILGSAMSTVANTVFAFLMFGAFLNACGANDIFRDLSIALAGKKRGGPAKMAVVASCIFGTISGSPISNVASTGAFTIPLMKRTGYKKEFAGAVEAVASTGGQIMPPIMGAAAFLLAEFTGISYSTVCLAALVPALMYYLNLFLVIDCTALKEQLMGLAPEDIPPLKPVLKRSAKLIVPVIVLLLSLLVWGKTAARSAFYATLAVIICDLLDREDRFNLKKLHRGIMETARSSVVIYAACGCAGIITSMLSLTGLGLAFSNFIFKLGGSNLFLALFFAMVVSIILGMGLPTTVAYIVTATAMSSAFTKMGLPTLSSHMFLLYFASMSNITPPVAIAAYTGAAIADASPMKVGIQSVKLGIVGFIVPYIFIYNSQLLSWDFSTPYLAFDTCITLLSACLVAFPLAYGVVGFTSRKLPVWLRAGYLGLAVLLILPYWYINIPAAVVTVALIVRTVRAERKYERTFMRKAAPEQA